jgi:predicted amidohydrolase YtcJ
MKEIRILILLIFIASCNLEHSNSSVYDTLIINADLYNIKGNNGKNLDAIGILDGKIKEIGKTTDLLSKKSDHTKIIDAKGNFTMPGFIEGHGHFSGLGYSMIRLNFLKSKSWEEIVAAVAEKVKNTQPGEWIVGRGWHQEKWDSIPFQNIHSYPFHYELSKISPDNPVLLRHASGHSLYANAKAMELSDVSRETSSPDGGEIVRARSGEAIGVFEERAMSLINNTYQDYLNSLSQEDLINEWYEAIEEAQRECLKKGITSFQDAGSRYDELARYEKMALDKKLDLRLWVMARHNSKDLEGKVGSYRKIGVGNDFYTCRAIKSEVDGALGAFGAWLLKPYADKPDFIGQNTTDIYEVKKIADIALQNDMQLCVHAIGDRANRVVLDIFENSLLGKQKDEMRWRMEHAQHLDTTDIPRFKKYGIIASMQGIHCTSDAPFVEKRLGYERAKYGAYPWRSLLDKGVIIANGTDAPVEDVDPIESFYASVTRKRIDNGFEFFPEQSMSREEAIYSYTLGNAYAAFEEDIKGSLEIGKYADIVILSNNLVNCTDEEILTTKVVYTMVNGEIKYSEEL